MKFSEIANRLTGISTPFGRRHGSLLRWRSKGCVE